MRIHRTIQDMALKGLYKGTMGIDMPVASPISTFSSGGKDYSIDYRMKDSQERVYIPTKAIPSTPLVSTGERVMYDSGSQLLEALDQKIVRPIDAVVTAVKIRKPFGEAEVRRAYLQGEACETVNRRSWLAANSLDNVLLPTAANHLCFKCGMTVNCRCDKFTGTGRVKD